MAKRREFSASTFCRRVEYLCVSDALAGARCGPRNSYFARSRADARARVDLNNRAVSSQVTVIVLEIGTHNQRLAMTYAVGL